MGKKSNLFIPPKKTLDEDPHTDVLLTVKNTTEQKEFKENQEPGLLIISGYFWIGASLNGNRKSQCCDPTEIGINYPFLRKDLDSKIAFLLPTVDGKKDENGNFFSTKIIYIISKFRLAWQFWFWATVVATVCKFYCQQVVPS
ncbi:unnamed protein product [Pocillopora meandrina]|uniref:Uncharacterized protein n=1 Tax=Pocillopora meandrina TaxID=46732 RepID=A0AAU9WQX7_9CNID|nr:unnamed protein product [Pocillopora meandrina]